MNDIISVEKSDLIIKEYGFTPVISRDKKIRYSKELLGHEVKLSMFHSAITIKIFRQTGDSQIRFSSVICERYLIKNEDQLRFLIEGSTRMRNFINNG